jgi:hypothetical protein
MNCRSAESLFSAFLDDALSQAERRSFEAHVLGCRRCSVSLREFKGTLALLGDVAKAPAAEVGPHFDDDLMARIRSGEAMRPSVVEWLRGAFTFDRLRPALAAGATACVLIVAVVALWPHQDGVSDAPIVASQEAAPATEAAPPATDVASAGVEDAGVPAAPSRAPAEPPADTPSATPATLAASTPSAPAPRESGADATLRPLAGDEANGIIQVVDRVVPGTHADLDSALPNPGSLFTDEYVTDQFYLQRTGAFVGPQQPTSVPVSDRGSDDVYIEF